MLVLMATGCSSTQPVTEEQQAQATPEKKPLELNPLKWQLNPLEWDVELNPLEWDYKQANYDFREKYNFKIGEMWIVKPPRQFNPTQVVVVRSLGDVPSEPASQESVQVLYDAYVQQKEAMPGMLPAKADLKVGTTQMMVIDLLSCDAIMHDTDGREYPCQVDPAVAQKLVSLTTDPKWLMQPKGKIKNVGVDEWGYRGLFQETASEYKPVLRSWKISETSVNADVTEAQQLLTQAFEVAHRAVHPLSESVNLIK
jgi:hypothetical protein